MIRPVRADGQIDAGGVFTPIYRSRVVERIAAAAQQRVVLIVAPAGYGKSTALRQYLDGLGEKIVRYDLRPENGTLLGFIRGFALSLAGVAPDLRNTVSTAFDSARNSPTAAHDLAMWMDAHLKAYTGIITIDDLHLAADEPEIARLLASLVDRTKERVRWILASRSFADLPVASWMAYQEMAFPIDESDLKFTPEEARETARASRIGVREDELNHLVELTEGWPTALSFALRSSTRAVDLRAINATTRDMVYRYLAEQVYATLRPSERELLATAVLLPEIDVEVLRCAGYANALSEIEELRHRVAFISKHPDRKGVYRCHDLFRDFVRYQAELEGAEALRARLARVSRVLEENGDTPRALRIYCELRANDDIVRLLDEHGFELFEEAHGDVVAFALETLPESIRRDSALALTLRGLLEAKAGAFDLAESLLARAARKAPTTELRAQIVLRAARITMNRGGNSLKSLGNLESDPAVGPDTRAEATSLIAIQCARAGDRDGCRVASDVALAVAESTESPQVQARILQRIALASLDLGDHDFAVPLFERAAEIALQCGLMSLASRSYEGLTNATATFGGDVALRSWYAQQMALTAGKSGDVFDIQQAALVLLDIEVLKGNAERAVTLEKQLGSLRTSDALRAIYIAGSQAWRQSWDGRFEEAYRTMMTVWPRFPVARSKAAGAALCAVYAAASGHADAARSLVAQALRVVEDATANYGLKPAPAIELALVSALAEAVAGRHTIAMRLVRRQKTAQNAAADCMRRCVVHATESLKTGGSLLEGARGDFEALRGFGYGGYVRLIEAVLAHAAQVGQDASTGLTPAELAVLGRLAQGATPKEIADQTGRSINTVNAHIQNIVEKLGCHGRREAVLVAKRLGLLAV
jgi:LuxR family maltose regulon positive regulatory protein